MQLLRKLGKKYRVLYTCIVVLLLGIMSVIAITVLHPVSDSAPQQASFGFEVARTPAQLERGLGGRTEIPHQYGMLFVFPRDGIYGFWMKDMQTSIDMLWLSETGKVIYLKRDVAPDTYPSVFYSPQPARYVLETRAGESVLMGWEIGSVVPLPLPYRK